MNKALLVLFFFYLAFTVIFFLSERKHPTQSSHQSELMNAQRRSDSIRRWADDKMQSDSQAMDLYVNHILSVTRDSMQKETDRRIALSRHLVDVRFVHDSGMIAKIDSSFKDTSCLIHLRCVEAAVLFASDSSCRFEKDSVSELLQVRTAECTTSIAHARVSQDSAVSIAMDEKSSLWKWITILVLGVFGIGVGAGFAL